MDIQEQMSEYISSHSFLKKLNDDYNIQLTNIINSLTSGQMLSLTLLIELIHEIRKHEMQISYKVGFCDGFHYNRRKRKECK